MSKGKDEENKRKLEEERIKKEQEQLRQQEEEQKRKKQEIDAEAQDLEAKKKAADQRLADEKAAHQQPAEAETKITPEQQEQPQAVKPINEDGDWSKIVIDYKEKYPEEPVNNGVLIFPNRGAVTDFFTAQAKQNRVFLCVEITPEGQRTGHYEFSCGDGNLYSGGLEKIKDELEQSLKNDPSNNAKIQHGIEIINNAMKVNPANTARAALKDIKQEERAKEQRNEAAATKESEQPTAPTPLSTKP